MVTEGCGMLMMKRFVVVVVECCVVVVVEWCVVVVVKWCAAMENCENPKNAIQESSSSILLQENEFFLLH